MQHWQQANSQRNSPITMLCEALPLLAPTPLKPLEQQSPLDKAPTVMPPTPNNINKSSNTHFDNTTSFNKTYSKNRIFIIGAGYAGVILAIELKKRDYNVTLITDGYDILIGGSSEFFGIRCHVGPHYDLSAQSRLLMRKNAEIFKKNYPELVINNNNKHDNISIYAISKKPDLDNKPSKTNEEAYKKQLKKINEEVNGTYIGQLPLKESNRLGLTSEATYFKVREESLKTGKRARDILGEKLQVLGIPIITNTRVIGVRKYGYQYTLTTQSTDPKNHSTPAAPTTPRKYYRCENVINTTGYQTLDLQPTTKLPGNLRFAYQVCLGFILTGRKKQFHSKTWSIIWMSGKYPCLMPIVNDSEENQNNYWKFLMTHGALTLIYTSNDPKQAHQYLNNFKQNIEQQEQVKEQLKKELENYWPSLLTEVTFSNEFFGSVLAKPITNEEFRASVVFQHKELGMFITPGKITCTGGHVTKEVLKLLSASDECRVPTLNYSLHKLLTYIYNTKLYLIPVVLILTAIFAGDYLTNKYDLSKTESIKNPFSKMYILSHTTALTLVLIAVKAKRITYHVAGESYTLATDGSFHNALKHNIFIENPNSRATVNINNILSNPTAKKVEQETQISDGYSYNIDNKI